MSNPYRDESLPSNSESRGTKHTATVSPADARKSQTLVSNAEMATQAGSPNSGERFATLHAHTHNRLRHIIPARRYWRPIRQFSQTNFDLEKQLPKNVVQLLRDRISQALFGKQCEDDKTLLSSTAYLDHIQEQIHEVGEGRLEQLLRVLHASLPAADEAYLRIVADLAEILREDQRQDKTIHNLLTKLLQRYGVEEKTLVDDDRIAGWQAIFLVLCWLTMAIQPGAHAEAESFSIPLPSCCISIQKPQRVDAARRSIIGLFRGFGQLLPEFDGPTAKQSSTLLYVSSLNFKALRLFGRVRIDWTNALSAHLQFHPSTRTLHVFRFPSVCAMILMAGPRGSIFHRYVALDHWVVKFIKRYAVCLANISKTLTHLPHYLNNTSKKSFFPTGSYLARAELVGSFSRSTRSLEVRTRTSLTRFSTNSAAKRLGNRSSPWAPLCGQRRA